jgi:aspartate/tyrosine/aromatic aminotransferase
VNNYSFFDTIAAAPEDPILGLPALAAKDPRPNKVNLGIGSYKTAEGKSLLLNSVKKAESLLLQKNAARDYLPIEGDPLFNQKIIELVLGPEAPLERVYGFQTIGGSYALRLGGEFLSRHLSSLIFLSQPTWMNHHLIFSHCGLTIETYPYYDKTKAAIDFDKMKEALDEMPPGSIILLQTACHNPTGASFTREQWEIVGKIILEKRLFPFLDNAYQGFGKSLEEDVAPIRIFLNMGLEMFIATSCSKNFGLYGERVGALIYVSNHKDSLPKVSSQLKKIVRSFCSTPPIHGAAVVREILNSPELKEEWKAEVEQMRKRVATMRHTFSEALNSKSGKNYSFIHNQEGFFSMLNVSEEQVLNLRHTHGIYLPTNGRINIAGLTVSNLEHVVDALISL